MANLIAALVAFVGTHFLLSHPLRAPLVSRLGANGFQGIYIIVALGTFALVYFAWVAAPRGDYLWPVEAGHWIASTIIMLAASILLVGSFIGNPALPAPGAAALASKPPHGVFQVTRHPMMWSLALWSAAHLLVSPTPRVIVLSLAVAVLALAGSHLQDRKKEVLMGEAWQGWEAKTSYWPKWGALGKAGAVPLLGGIALWLAASWAHGWLIAIPAGVWRWL